MSDEASAAVRESVVWRKCEFGRKREEAGQRPLPPPVSLRQLQVVVGTLTLFLLGWLMVRTVAPPSWLVRLPAVGQELLKLGEQAGVGTLLLLWGVVAWLKRTQVADGWDLGLPTTVRAALPSDLQSLTPAEFETFVADLFRRKGYGVKVSGQRGDKGVDLRLRQANGKTAVVQCKRYQRAVGPEVVRELYGTLIHEKAAHGFLVTTAVISPAAREWARLKPITLIDGQMLAEIAQQLIVNSG